MENNTSPIPDFPQNFQNPQNSSTPPSNKKKWIFISILILAIVGGTAYYLGIGGGNFLQGKISRVKTPNQEVDSRSKTTTKKAESKVKEGKKDKAIETAPLVKPEEPKKSQEPQSPIFDEKTVLLSYGVTPAVKDSDKFVTFNTGKTSGSIGNYELNMPKFSPENLDKKENSYTQTFVFEACKDNLSQCIELKKGTKIIYKYPYSPLVSVIFGYDSLEKIVKELNLKHNDNIEFRYRVTDPTGIELKSNVLTVQVKDDKAPPAIPAGQTLLNKDIFKVNYNPDNNYKIEESSTKLYFDILSKSPIEFFVTTPTYDLKAFPDLKDKYSIPFNLQACNKNMEDCKEVFAGSEITIWNKQKKNADAITTTSNIKYDQLKALLKERVEKYNGEFTLFFTLKDPSGIEIQSNPLKLIVSEEDKAYLTAGPIEGTLFDEKTFKILSSAERVKIREGSNDKDKEDPDNYLLADGKLQYDPAKLGALLIAYQLPALKIGETEKNKYDAMVYLDYCNEDFTDCVEVSSLDADVFKKYPINLDNAYPSAQIRQTVIPDAELDALVKDNPGKSYFRYRVKDPTGPEIYSNSYQLVVE